MWWAEQESGPRLSSPPAMNEGAVQEGLAFLSAAPCQLRQLWGILKVSIHMGKMDNIRM